MTISSPPILDIADVAADWPDDVHDLTDRRRLMLLAVFGVEVPAEQADAVFAGGAAASRTQSSSTTMRSAGRASSTDDK
jgi:hypothetical protein